jgi:hypothetical protein
MSGTVEKKKRAHRLAIRRAVVQEGVKRKKYLRQGGGILLNEAKKRTGNRPSSRKTPSQPRLSSKTKSKLSPWT